MAAAGFLRNSKIKYHTTKGGNKIKLSDLKQGHLENIIKWIERKAKYGLLVRSGGGSCAEDMWFDEEVFYGEWARCKLKYHHYIEELNKRK